LVEADDAIRNLTMAVVFVAAAIAFVAVGQPDTVQSVS
jgi:hypothetical protein